MSLSTLALYSEWYREYKVGTQELVNWLACERLSPATCDYHIHTLSVKGMISAAQEVAQQEHTPHIPDGLLHSLRVVIRLRKQCGQCHPRGIDAGHQHFVTQLENIQSILVQRRVFDAGRQEDHRAHRPSVDKAALLKSGPSNVGRVNTPAEPHPLKDTTSTSSPIIDEPDPSAVALWCVLQEFRAISTGQEEQWSQLSETKASRSVEAACVTIDAAIRLMETHHKQFTASFPHIQTVRDLHQSLGVRISRDGNNYLVTTTRDWINVESNERVELSGLVHTSGYGMLLSLWELLHPGCQAPHSTGAALFIPWVDTRTLSQAEKDFLSNEPIIARVCELQSVDRAPFWLPAAMEIYLKPCEFLGLNTKRETLWDQVRRRAWSISKSMDGIPEHRLSKAQCSAKSLAQNIRRFDPRACQPLRYLQQNPVFNSVLGSDLQLSYYYAGLDACNDGRKTIVLAYFYRALLGLRLLKRRWKDCEYLIAAHHVAIPSPTQRASVAEAYEQFAALSGFSPDDALPGAPREDSVPDPLTLPVGDRTDECAQDIRALCDRRLLSKRSTIDLTTSPSLTASKALRELQDELETLQSEVFFDYAKLARTTDSILQELALAYKHSFAREEPASSPSRICGQILHKASESNTVDLLRPFASVIRKYCCQDRNTTRLQEETKIRMRLVSSKHLFNTDALRRRNEGIVKNEEQRRVLDRALGTVTSELARLGLPMSLGSLQDHVQHPKAGRETSTWEVQLYNGTFEIIQQAFEDAGDQRSPSLKRIKSKVRALCRRLAPQASAQGFACPMEQ